MNINEKVKQDFVKLGLHIQNLREEKGMTIKDLSIKTGIRKEYLKKIENGTAYGLLIDRHLLKIAIGLNIHFYKLMDFQ